MGYFKGVVAILLLGLASLAVSQTVPAVVRSGAITLKVADFRTARAAVSQIAVSSGGHVVGGQDRVTEKGKSHGWMRLVVPEAQLDAVMRELRGAGVVYGDSLTAHDQSQEVQELASRTTRLQQHQDRLSGVLRSPRQLRGSDILFFQERLFRAGLDEDLLSHRREQMISSSNVSNISVYLFEPGSIKVAPPVPATFGEKTAYAFGAAWKSFGKFIEGAGLLTATLVVYGLVWVPILVVLYLLWRKFGSRLRFHLPRRTPIGAGPPPMNPS